MARLQLALNVADLAASIDFYTRMFGVEPAKVKPGYANFAIADPPLKLVLFETADGAAAGSLNHLGVEVDTRDDVAARFQHVSDAGLTTRVEGETTCCFAVQDKFWVEGADNPWEVYTVLAPAEVMSPVAVGATANAATGCCG